MVRWLLPRRLPVVRVWLGISLGVLLMMWLPALMAFFVTFSVTGHLLSLIPLALLTGLCYLWRDKSSARAFGAEDRQALRLLLCLALPMTLLSCYLIYTHDLRPMADGSLHTGQATYGDLSLHLSIITSLRNARFPADYAIMPGERLSYPFLTDSFTTSFMLGGCSLRVSLLMSSALMLSLVFAGYMLLCQRLARSRAGAVLAFLMFFLNGGLGFMYILDMVNVPLGYTADNGEVSNALQAMGGLLPRLRNVMQGWYQTPTNHAEFDRYNLRWSNVIADMLIPQRTTMGGWCMLMPPLWLLTDTLLTCGRDLPERRALVKDSVPQAFDGLFKDRLRQTVLLAVFAGGLPMIHTHSFAALAFCSFGFLLYTLFRVRWQLFCRTLPLWGVYVGVTALLALPQLFLWTFSQALGQAESTGSFLAFHFNWVNRYGDGLKDGYLWFYLKNVGLPYLLILLALLEKDKRARFLGAGAFVIYLAAELVRFQPNEYDNNKLFYVWFMLSAPMAADCGLSLLRRLKGLRARPVLAVLCVIVLFLSGGLSIAHECVTDWELYSAEDVETAAFVENSTPEHAVFMSGTQFLNPVSSLAGRRVVCGPDLWLYYHGFDTGSRHRDIRAFYRDPANGAEILQKYGARYILVSRNERSELTVDETALSEAFDLVFESAYGSTRIYRVKEENGDG